MRKINFLLLFFFFTACVFAQGELVSKKGEPILPEKGDWAISIDASPFLRYAGNFFGSNGLNVSPTFDFLSGSQAILGKYYVDGTKVYRVGLRLGVGSTSTTTKVSSMYLPSLVTYVDNVTKVSQSNIGLTAGVEWRKGKTRLQGFYGAEAGVRFGTNVTNMTYGNALSASNPMTRIVEDKSGSTLSLGMRVFIGAEYFIFPKIALGGEFGWGMALKSVGKGEYKSESWTGSAVKSTVTPVGETINFGFDSDKLSSLFGAAGTLRLTLHF